jgi:hypothetical protein
MKWCRVLQNFLSMVPVGTISLFSGFHINLLRFLLFLLLLLFHNAIWSCGLEIS